MLAPRESSLDSFGIMGLPTARLLGGIQRRSDRKIQSDAAFSVASASCVLWLSPTPPNRIRARRKVHPAKCLSTWAHGHCALVRLYPCALRAGPGTTTSTAQTKAPNGPFRAGEAPLWDGLPKRQMVHFGQTRRHSGMPNQSAKWPIPRRSSFRLTAFAFAMPASSSTFTDRTQN